MASPCDFCEIRKGCDFLSGMCRLTAAQVARFRPDLIGGGQMRNRMKWAEINAPIFAAKREEQQATASLGFAKYDRRRKNAKGYWRKGRRQEVMAAVKELRSI